MAGFGAEPPAGNPTRAGRSCTFADLAPVRSVISAGAKQPFEAARSFSNGSDWSVSSRQSNGELSERARLAVDLDRAAMLLHDDVIPDR
jgi:hypothetical protein